MTSLGLKAVGQRSDYACDKKPLGSGGYAVVHRAIHKPTGTEVALKRLRKSVDDTAADRMQREIKVMRQLDHEKHVMSVIDFSVRWNWYVMPLAVGDAYALRNDLIKESGLVDLLRACLKALTAAHEAQYVHRDLTPHNILRLPGGLWVVSDWGLVRARPGHTTRVLTSSGSVVGTDGFVAPEVMRGHSHGNEPAADVYSLGRVAAWAVTGITPLAGEELLPSGPFRQLVRSATRDQPSARPSLPVFTEMLSEIDLEPPPLPADEASLLVEEGREGKKSAWTQLLELALDHLSDAELILDYVAKVPQARLNELAEEDIEAVSRLAEAMRQHLEKNFGERSFSRLDEMLLFILRCCRASVAVQEMGPLEDCAVSLCAAEADCHQYGPRHKTRQWLEEPPGGRGQDARPCPSRERQSR